MRERTLTEWTLDVGGGVLSLLAAPLVTSAIALALMNGVWPSSRAVLSLPAWAAFLLSFLALDYAQYWTHRWWHSRSLWAVHFLHHTLARMNAVGALRHSFWEAFFNPAAWINGVLIYLLADRSWYLIGLSTGLMLDFWRHSAMPAKAGNLLARQLRRILVTPEAHAMHHAEGAVAVNFGSNLILWDRWHRTYAAAAPVREPLGVPLPRRPLWLLLWPARTSGSSAASSHAG